MTEKKQV